MVGPIALADIALRAAEWANKVAAERRSRSEKQAANLMRDAGILTAAVQALVNDTYSLIAALGRFDTDWTAEQRERLYDRVTGYMAQHTTIPFIDTSIAALETWTPSQLDNLAGTGATDAVQDLVRWGKLVADRDHYSKETYFVLGELPTFWSRLKEARALEDLDWLASWAKSIDEPPWTGVDVADNTEVADNYSERQTAAGRARRINEAFGRLSATLLRRHPGIPPPTWTQHITAGDVTE